MKKQIVCCTAAILLAAGGLGTLPAGTLGTAIAASAAAYEDFEYSVDGDTVTITEYKGNGGDVVIPSEIDGKKVTAIGEFAFEGSDLTSVTIPDTVTSIGWEAFRYCGSLKNVTIPDSVTDFGWAAFKGCSSLKSVTLPDSVKTISTEMFMDCDILESVTISDSVTSIESEAFAGCGSLKSVTIGKGVTELAVDAFHGCSNLTDIKVDANNTTYCSVDGVIYSKDITALILCPAGRTSITIPDSVKNIGSSSFSGSALTSIDIPDGVTSIDSYAFKNSQNLKNVTIPESVTAIGEEAFCDCPSLRSVTLPASVRNIGEYALGYVTETYDCEDHYFLIEDFVLYCHPGAGKKYAKKNKIKLTDGDTSMPSDNPETGVEAPLGALALATAESLAVLEMIAKKRKNKTD